jgi:drug/metabolite transporter (DMT)-like permease
MKKTALLAFACLGVIWGSNFIFMKWAADEITAEQIVLLRVAFGFLPVFFYALSQRALRQEHVRYAPYFVVTGAKRGERAGGAALSPKAVNARSPLITPRACRA